jgi:hypothetical protein
MQEIEQLQHRERHVPVSVPARLHRPRIRSSVG